MKNTQTIIREQVGNRGSVISIDEKYIYVEDQKTGDISAYDYAGLKKWLTNFIQRDSNKKIEVSCNANTKVLIPDGSWIHGIRVKGSATGITIGFMGYSYSIATAVGGYEIIPHKQFSDGDNDLTIQATSWGKVKVIIIV